MNTYRAAEKINDLFMVSLSDLESTIVSNIIKLSSQPTKLIEETQQTLNDYKQRFYNSLIQLITYISQQISMNPKELQKIAESLEQELIKYKQKHLLFQMKAMLNSKIKALLDTLNYESTNQKQKNEIQQSIHTLTESLAKIEQTLQCSPSSPNHITPLPRRQEDPSLALTPNLSDDAQNKVKQNFITPKQGNVLLVHNNQTPAQHSPQTSGLQNRTINSFNNEHENQNFQLRENLNDHIHQLLNMEFNNDRKFENQFINTQLVESIEIKKKPAKSQSRKYSAQSISLNQNTPSEHKQFHSTRSKDLLRRSQQMPESVNLLSKLNQAEDKDRKKKTSAGTLIKKNSNKENFKVVNNRQPVKTALTQNKKKQQQQ